MIDFTRRKVGPWKVGKRVVGQIIVCPICGKNALLEHVVDAKSASLREVYTHKQFGKLGLTSTENCNEGQKP